MVRRFAVPIALAALVACTEEPRSCSPVAEVLNSLEISDARIIEKGEYSLGGYAHEALLVTEPPDEFIDWRTFSVVVYWEGQLCSVAIGDLYDRPITVKDYRDRL